MRAIQGLKFPMLGAQNWQAIVLVALAGFYLANFGFKIVNSRDQIYSVDILAFWSVGKIADTLGYSHVYDLENLKSVQAQAMYDNGMLEQQEIQKFPPTPVPYLSIFIVPLQLFSGLSVQTFCLLWLMINILALNGYLFFFYKQLHLGTQEKAQGIYLVLLLIFSYPVFDNFNEAQINVFLMICVGEFIRNASRGKPILAGKWLAGLLLKPQLLVLILPIMLILHYWKVLIGFISASVAILLSSWALSGTIGMEHLVSLLTKYSAGMAVNATDIMINWRMVGVDLNALTHSSIGWVVTSLGMIATLIAVIYLVAQKPAFGNLSWAFMILGVLSATLAFTWHSHNHMAMILVPALLLPLIYGGFSRKALFIWALIPPLIWISVAMIAVLFPGVGSNAGFNFLGFSFVLSRFVANQVVLLSVLIKRRKIVDQSWINLVPFSHQIDH